MPKDLLYPSQADEKKKHKLKRLVQSPNSFFMDVRCPGCFHISTVFSHAQVCTVPILLGLYTGMTAMHVTVFMLLLLC